MYVAISQETGSHLAFRVKRPSDRQSLSRSATRALDVLEAFGETRGPLRAVQIARLLGLPRSTANQLLKTMVESAHLLFDARHKTYLPSPRLARISDWIAEIYSVGDKLLDLVNDIHKKTGMVVTISTPNDLLMQVIEAASADPGVAERGLHVPLFGTAIGSAYLSTVDEKELLRLADRARIPPSALPAMLKTIEQIRATGNADGPSTAPGIWSLAMPLPREGLCVPVVLGLAGPSETICSRLPEFSAILSGSARYWLAIPELRE